MGKRIRYPKKVKKVSENKPEEQKHFVLQVQDSGMTNPVKIGIGQQSTKNS